MTVEQMNSICDWIIAKAKESEIYAEYQNDECPVCVGFDIEDIERANAVSLSEDDIEDIIYELEHFRSEVDCVIENKDEEGNYLYYEPDLDIYLF